MGDQNSDLSVTLSRASSGRAPSWLVTVVQTPAKLRMPQRYRLSERVTRLHRSPVGGAADLVIPDPAISNAKVCFEIGSTNLRVSDSGSRNPMRVNGREVASADLSANDVLRLGDTLIVLDLDDPARAVGKQPAFQDPDVQVLMSRLHMHASTTALQFQVDACLLNLVERVVLLWTPTAGACEIARDWVAAQWRREVTHVVGDDASLLDIIAKAPPDDGLIIERFDLAAPATQRALIGALADRQASGHTLITLDASLRHRLPHALESLLARVRCAHLEIPPLRARKADIVYALRSLLKERGLDAELPFHPSFTERLLAHDWPNGLVELHSLADRVALAVARGTDVNAAILPSQFAAIDAEVGGSAPAEFSEEALVSALVLYRGNMKRVAEHFSLSRPYLYKKLKAYGLSLDELRAEATRRFDSDAAMPKDDERD